MFYPQERDETARKTWSASIAKLDVSKLVFIDESSTFLNISRAYGWAHTSERVFDTFPKGKKERVSLIAAIGLNVELAEHSLVHPDSVDKKAFKAFLSSILLPKLEPGTILVLDNWKVHHGEDIRELVESYGCELLYLPSYSPDFNPIEFLFSKVKAFIKMLRPMNMPELLQAFQDATKTVSLVDIKHTFRHCGYLVH